MKYLYLAIFLAMFSCQSDDEGQNVKVPVYKKQVEKTVNPVPTPVPQGSIIGCLNDEAYISTIRHFNKNMAVYNSGHVFARSYSEHKLSLQQVLDLHRQCVPKVLSRYKEDEKLDQSR